jgi:hypothetical protein
MKPRFFLGLGLVLASGLQAANTDASVTFPESAEPLRIIARQEAISFFQQSHFMLPHVPANSVEMTKGHKCYVFDYHAVLAGKILSMASTSSGGWQYMMMSGTNMVGTMGLELSKKGRWQFGGSMMAGTNGTDPIWVALQKAEKLPQVQRHDYEFRYLILSIEFWAIWLHGKSDDIIIPISVGDRWNIYQPYSEAQVVGFLKLWMERMPAQIPGQIRVD